MTSLAKQIAIELVAAEEQARLQSQPSAAQVPAKAPEIQQPTQENVSTTIGKKQFFLTSEDNLTVPENGVFVDLSANNGQTIYLNKVSFSTATEWTLLKMSIDTKLYKEGNYTFFDDLGYAYYDPITSLYHFSIFKGQVDTRFTLTIDSGIVLNTLILDYYLQ